MSKEEDDDSPPLRRSIENEELFHKLMECCEQAYSDGLDSADIYKVLHSTSLILAGKKTAASVNHDDDLYQNSRTKKHRHLLYSSFLNFFGLICKVLSHLKKALVGLISLLLIGLILHSIVCGLFLNVSPFKTLAVFLPDILLLKDKSCLLPSHPVIMEMVRPILDCSMCQSIGGGSPVIEFDSRPSKEEFMKVAYSSKPIIVRGGALASGMPISFNFSMLKAIFESEPGGIESVSEECQFLPLRSPFQTLAEALEAISKYIANENLNQPPWYIGWSNCHPGVASKLRKLFPRPDFLPDDSESSAIDWIFVGSPGRGAAMHIDYVRRPSWQAQLSGCKTWVLRPPPDCESSCQNHISFSINPGDLLFLETNSWYHETTIDRNELSISIGSEYD